MSEKKRLQPFQQLGIALKNIRLKRRESLAEVSGAVEIEIEQLAEFERGIRRPSEDVLLLLISHFAIKEDHATQLWEIAGYDQSDVPSIHMMNDNEGQAKPIVAVIMIGIGSNIVWTDGGFPGLVLVNKIMQYEDFAQDDPDHYVTVGGGENWDEVVARTVEAGLTGIEYLSLIPGTAGATPVQNVGAYGQELSNVLVSVEAYDKLTHRIVTIPNSDCGFGYRTSRFKTNDRGRFFISGLTLHLTKGNPTPPFYESLQMYLSQNHVTEFTPKIIRDAVIAIRTSKLPDPAVVANNGSFFANPVVERSALTQLKAANPDIVSWEVDDTHVKLSAAWLVENAGFKEVHDSETGMATWPKQSLVLVNEHAQSTADLLKFKQKIVDGVQAKFGITLEQEPELLGS